MKPTIGGRPRTMSTPVTVHRLPTGTSMRTCHSPRLSSTSTMNTPWTAPSAKRTTSYRARRSSPRSESRSHDRGTGIHVHANQWTAAARDLRCSISHGRTGGRTDACGCPGGAFKPSAPQRCHLARASPSSWSTIQTPGAPRCMSSTSIHTSRVTRARSMPGASTIQPQGPVWESSRTSRRSFLGWSIPAARASRTSCIASRFRVHPGGGR